MMHLPFSLLSLAALVALLLVCGVFWGLYFALSRSYQGFSPSELAKVARTIVANLEVPMRNLSMLYLALMGLSIFFYPDKGQWNFWAMIASLLFLISSLVITTVRYRLTVRSLTERMKTFRRAGNNCAAASNISTSSGRYWLC